MRVSRFDERDFLFSTPAFELLLAGDGFVYIVIGSPIEKALNPVFISESLSQMEFVFEDSLVQVSTEAHMQSAGRLPIT
jgi:hypothetical protein